MPHINDTAATILANAAARPDLKVFPLPETLRVNAATASRVLDKLVNTGLLAGVGATTEDKERGRTTLIVTPEGMRAINIEPEGASSEHATAAAAASQPATNARPANKPIAKAKPAPRNKADKKPPAKTKAANKAPTGALKRATSAKSGRGGVKAAKTAASSRAGLTKQQVVVGMLRRANGASIEELARATDWQHHSVRGVLTATIKGRLNLPLTSEKGEDGVRRYFIAPIRTSKDKG